MSIRESAQAALDALNNSDACHYSGVQTAMSELRRGLAEPQGEPDAAGLLHDRAHVDTGKTRAAQSVRTPEMSYRPGSLPMEDAPVACEWTHDADGFYKADCGNADWIPDDDPPERYMTYCYGCGKRIRFI